MNDGFKSCDVARIGDRCDAQTEEETGAWSVCQYLLVSWSLVIHQTPTYYG